MLLNGRHILVTIQYFFFNYQGKNKKKSSDKGLNFNIIMGYNAWNNFLKKKGKQIMPTGAVEQGYFVPCCF